MVRVNCHDCTEHLIVEMLIKFFWYSQVVLANNRGEGTYRDPQEDEKMLRIFVIIPKEFGNKDLRKNFEVSYISSPFACKFLIT
jgi:hypothetical protein